MAKMAVSLFPTYIYSRMIRIENGESSKWICIVWDKHLHLTKCGHIFDINTGGGDLGFECPECYKLQGK